MLPCTTADANRRRRPTSSAPCRHPPSAPHAQQATINAATPSTATDQRRRSTRSTDQKSAAADDASTSKNDRPYTPVRLASCAIGSTVTWLYPSSAQGKPSQTYCRPSSVATQTGAAHSTAPWTPSDLPQPRDGHRERGGKERQVGNEQARDEDRDRQRQPAERRHRLDQPVERAGEIAGAGQQAEEEGAASRPRRRRSWTQRARR